MQAVRASLLVHAYTRVPLHHRLQRHRTPLLLQYAEFRTGFDKDKDDARLIFFGLRYILENFVSRQWTHADVTKAALFFK